MSLIELEKNQTVIVARTGTSEQLVKIRLVEVEPGKVRLDLATDDRVAVYTSDVWEQMQAERRAGKRDAVNDRPLQRAPYMN